MPRPSLKETRSREILDAFTVCVGRYGLEGATLDRIAEMAGVKRPILRHYLGNREDMVAALIEHLGRAFDAQTDALLGAMPADLQAGNRIDCLLAILFDPETVTDPDTVAALQAMVAASGRYPQARRVLKGAIARLLAAIEQELAVAYPGASQERVAATAFGLIGIYFTLDALGPLRLPEDWRRSARQSATILIGRLGDSS